MTGRGTLPKRISEARLLDWEHEVPERLLSIPDAARELRLAAVEIRRYRAIILGFIAGQQASHEELRAEAEAIREERPKAAKP